MKVETTVEILFDVHLFHTLEKVQEVVQWGSKSAAFCYAQMAHQKAAVADWISEI